MHVLSFLLAVVTVLIPVLIYVFIPRTRKVLFFFWRLWMLTVAFVLMPAILVLAVYGIAIGEYFWSVLNIVGALCWLRFFTWPIMKGKNRLLKRQWGDEHPTAREILRGEGFARRGDK